MAIMTIGNFYIIFAGCIASLIVLWTKPLHINHTAKGHTSLARQSSHCLPTPRIGGLIIILGYSVGVCFLPKSDATSIATLLGLSALPVFLGGFGEDTGFNISTRLRLILSFVSAMIAGLLFNSWIPSLGISGLAFVTDYAIPAVLLTVIISAGISHAFNLIDGLNGLAMGIALIVDIGLGSLAFLAGDIAIASICSILAASLVGILIFNFPLGKIFLGDAGAYSVGHILVWIAILLLNRNSDIAPFAILLMFFWPIADMLFSIYRRYSGGRPIDQPDRLHFHQMVMRALELTFLAKKTRELTNPLATTGYFAFGSGTGRLVLLCQIKQYAGVDCLFHLYGAVFGKLLGWFNAGQALCADRFSQSERICVWAQPCGFGCAQYFQKGKPVLTK